MVCGVRIMVLADAENNNQLAINRLYIILYIPSKLENGDLGNQGHGQTLLKPTSHSGAEFATNIKLPLSCFSPNFPCFTALNIDIVKNNNLFSNTF